MAITNINTIQSSLSNEYILQSLANLGQRYSVAGDSIKLDYFTIGDLYNITNTDFTGDIAKITAVNNDIMLYIINKDTETIDTNCTTNTVTLSSILKGIQVTTSLTTSNITNVQGIKYYGSGDYPGYIINLTYHYITAFFGYDNTGKIVEFNCLKINKNTSELYSAFRIYNVNNRATAIYINNSNDVYYGEIGSSVLKPTDIFANINKLLTSIGDDIYTNIDPDYFKLNLDMFTYQYLIDITYNTASNQYFSYSNVYVLSTYNQTYNTYILNGETEAASKKAAKDASIYYGNVDYPITTLLTYFAYDIAEFYPYIKEYYSEYKYNRTDDYYQQNSILKYEILAKLYTSIIENNYDASTNSIINIYVPLNYKFEYTYNSNEEWQIYNSANNVAVEYLENLNVCDLEDNAIFCQTNIATRISTFSFSVNYEEISNKTLIKNCNAVKQYTLPYIYNNYWVINDVITSIKAKGEDAGNPNIVIVYSKSKDEDSSSYEILSGANKSNVLESISWKKQLINVEQEKSINLEDTVDLYTNIDNIKIYNWVPDISSLNLSKDSDVDILNAIKYALIINIASINCVEYDANISTYDKSTIEYIYGEYGTITSFWSYDEDNMTFKCIQVPENYSDTSNIALDMTKLTNFSNLIKWNFESVEYKHPDKYRFTYLVFDSSYVSLKNNTSDNQTYIYGNIRNNSSEYYKINKNINYSNDLNLSIQYNDNVTGAEDDEITDITQTVNTRYGQLYTASSVESAASVTNNFYTYGDGIINNYYNEYLPDYNIPTLDLSEVLVRNSNTLNKLNILSVGNDGLIYNSYIGTSYVSEDKSRLIIGSSNTNINVGTDTLFNKNDIGKFTKQDQISLEFNQTYIAAYTYIGNSTSITGNITSTGNFINKIQSTKSNAVNVIHYTPIGRYLYEQNYVFNPTHHGTSNITNFGDPTDFYCKVLNTLEGTTGLNINYICSWFLNDKYNELMKFCLDYNKIWIPLTIRDPKYTTSKTVYAMDSVGVLHNLYFADALIIPVLIHQLGLGKYINNYEITSKSSNIIYCDDKPLLFIMHSTNLSENYLINQSNTILKLINNNNSFIGNTLTILYYINNNTLILNIEETEKATLYELPYQYITKYTSVNINI